MVTEAIEAELRVLEERLAMPAASESRASLAALLAPEFREFGSSGRIYDVAATLEALTPGARPRLVLEDFTVSPVADGAVLVTYRSKHVAGPPALRSSLWVRRSAGWQLLFHQGTRLPADEG